MIAQKVVDTKQPKQPESAFVTLPDLIAAAFRTFSHTDISFKNTNRQNSSHQAAQTSLRVSKTAVVW
jgi:hypothetical protein